MSKSRGGRQRLQGEGQDGPCGLCGRKATLNLNMYFFRAKELCESRSGRPGLPVRNSPYDLCGRKATLDLNALRQRSGVYESGGGRHGLHVHNIL